MQIMNRTNVLGLLLMLVAVALIAYQTLAGSRAQGPSQAPIVATVDVELVIDSLNAWADAEARRDDIRAQNRAEVEKLQRRLETLKADAQMFPPGSDSARKAEKEMLQLAAEIRALEEHGKRRVERAMARELRDIFDQVRTAARELAVEGGYDLVLADDSAAAIAPGAPEQVMQQMSLRRVLFSQPTLDITNDVIVHLNQ